MTHRNLRIVDQSGIADEPIEHGREGNLHALRRAALFVRRDALNPLIREKALEITAGVRGHDFAGERTALYEWVRDSITYRRDPKLLGDKVQSPVYTLTHKINNQLTGDCLDKSSLLCAFLASIGHEPKFEVLAQVAHADGAFDHVYVNDGGEALDTTPENKEEGFEAAGVERRFFPVFTKAQAGDLAGIGSFFKKILPAAAFVGVSLVPGGAPFAGAAAGAVGNLTAGGGGKAPKLKDSDIASIIDQATAAVKSGSDPETVKTQVAQYENMAGGGAMTVQATLNFNKAYDAAKAKGVLAGGNVLDTGASAVGASSQTVAGFPVQYLLIGGVVLFFLMRK
jgi:hypothetical protein